MFRRYRRRILNCTNRIRRWITGREGTLGNSIEDNNQQEIINNPDISIREIAKEHCKKVEKTYDDSMLGLIKIKDDDSIEIFEIGVYDNCLEEEEEKEHNINCLICLEKIDYTKDIRFIQGCCRQVYHIECIHKWVIDNNTCPTCKETVLIYKC